MKNLILIALDPIKFVSSAISPGGIIRFPNEQELGEELLNLLKDLGLRITEKNELNDHLQILEKDGEKLKVELKEMLPEVRIYC